MSIMLGLMIIFCLVAIAIGVIGFMKDKKISELEAQFQTLNTRNEELQIKITGFEEEKAEYERMCDECNVRFNYYIINISTFSGNQRGKQKALRRNGR